MSILAQVIEGLMFGSVVIVGVVGWSIVSSRGKPSAADEAERERAHWKKYHEELAVKNERECQAEELKRAQAEFDEELRYKIRSRNYLCDRGSLRAGVFNDSSPRKFNDAAHRIAEQKFIERKMKERPAM
ncbi:hypothetical protein ACSLNB_09135 [Citrobacter portucalensis]|uniref:hypothetical protein n=1 Tax=Citrobacter portucalensis TaxID=1639133 RepID=UPI003EDF66D3